MVFSYSTRRLSRVVLLFLVLVGSLHLGSRPAAAAMLRWVPGTTTDQIKPIVIRADNIAKWRAGNDLLFHVAGKVWIQQGLTNLHFDQGIIRVVRQGTAPNFLFHLSIFAEGHVSVEARSQNRSASQAFLGLQTRVELQFKRPDREIEHRSYEDTPLFQRARHVFITTAKTGLPNSPEIVASPAPKAFVVKDAKPLQPKRAAIGMPSAPRTTPTAPQFFDPQLKRAAHTTSRVTPTAPLQLTGGLQVPPNGQPPIEHLSQPRVVNQQPPDLSARPGVPPATKPVPGPGGFLGAFPITGNQQYFIRPRSTCRGMQINTYPLPSGETAVVVSSGVILTITNADKNGGLLDIEADRVVFWTRGHPTQIMQDLQSNINQKDRPFEFYLSGNVEIRTQTGTESRLLTADEVYYDVNRQVALATQADLFIDELKLIHPIHLQSHEILQLNKDLFKANDAKVSASELPYDPQLYLSVETATIETKPIVRRTIFGRPIVDLKTGQPLAEKQRFFKGKNVFIYMHDVPVFYLPFVQGDVDDPLGPLENFGVNANRVFGFQVYTTWDMYDLIGITPLSGTRWRLNLDYLSERGPAAGSDFIFAGEQLFDIPNRYRGLIKAYGVYDNGDDIIGGNRGVEIRDINNNTTPITHPDWRGRFLARINVQELPYGYMVQSQLSAISDRNFLEQYYRAEFQNELNQETFVYAKQQQGNWAWTGLVQPHIRNWITETAWLPRVDGYGQGLKFFDLITYNVWGSAGYAMLDATDEPPFAFRLTDTDTNTARFNLFQEVSVPFTLRPMRVVPYGIVDLTYYTNDVFGNDRGRLYGAAGVRGSVPMSRLYRDVDSDLFNLDGIFHKIMFTGNYYGAYSNTNLGRLPQLDRLNDDASDQALRNLLPFQRFFNPGVASLLTRSPLFDPQIYALRRLVMNRIDTRDDIQVIQLGVQQRWQTKRGFPGRKHIIDWMTLNLSGSVFPRPDRDNFGETFAFLEYDWIWNIGDRTSLTSTGWIDPIEDGPRVFTVGANLNRPDETNFYVGYRQIDPLSSKAVIASVAYRFSRKYSVTASTSYDFGIDQQVNTFLISRRGTDMRVSLGVTHDTILNNFGVVFEIVPNILPANVRAPFAPGTVSATGVGR